MDAESRGTPKEDAHSRGKDSREIAIHVGKQDTHGTSVPSFHTGKGKEKVE
jgi:hypothetical protein